MKKLYIIKSETPGITRVKFRTVNRKPFFAKNSEFKKCNSKTFDILKKNKKYKNKKILKIYYSSWSGNEFFIRCFM